MSQAIPEFEDAPIPFTPSLRHEGVPDVHFSDLKSLLSAFDDFERTQDTRGLPLEALETTCQRILDADPFEPLALAMRRILGHAREILSLGS